jgi:LDH2 family malate/lactate/ureidoglycolate dehydrogenase
MKVEPNQLKEVAIHILKGLKATGEEAAIVAESLVRADMRGIDTHGVHFLTLVAERVDGGMVQIPTHLTVVKESDTTVLIDGGNGLGQMACHRAMTLSMQKAKQFGLGCSLVRNTNNIGFLALYTLMAARDGMAGIVMTNAASAMSPWGGADAFFGTNPLSIAVPGGSDEPEVVLDMSSSLVARGKIRRAERLKEAIPPGWAFDETGTATTDPSAALKGTLMPVGGPKGYGLALIIDILAGMISGSKYGPDVKTFHQLLGPTGVGAFTLAIDIERFMPRQQFNQLIKPYLASIKGSRRAKGVSRIYLPGEIEFEKERQSLSEGIEISPTVAKTLNQLLEKVKSPLRISQG